MATVVVCIADVRIRLHAHSCVPLDVYALLSHPHRLINFVVSLWLTTRLPLAHLTPSCAHETRSQTCSSRGKVTTHTPTLNTQQMHARWPRGDPPCSLLCLLVPTLPGHPAKSYSFRGSCSSYCNAIKITEEHGSTTDMCVLSGDLPPHTL